MGGVFNQLQVPGADVEDDVVVQRALEFVKKDLCEDILPRLSKKSNAAETCFVAEVKKVQYLGYCWGLVEKSLYPEPFGCGYWRMQ
jgi:hypothetical protein